MRWYPQTGIGRISFWIGVAAFALIYIQYWIGMLFDMSVPLPGLLAVVALIGAGVSSAVALIKHKDRAILVFLGAFLGLLGVLLVAGELLFPH